ncbi:MAG: ABC transporter substrate-binding protein [Candidatus Thorarchaeota archaeon]
MRKLKLLIVVGLFLGSMMALAVTVPVSAQREGPEWFYDNLTAADRLKIRTAFDLAIPRDQVITSLMDGWAFKIATPVTKGAFGYDENVVPREFNQTKALDLLAEVFGYTYNESADDIEEREGYFPMTLAAPTSRDDRVQWATLVTKSFQEIGIDATIKFGNWNIMVPRVFDPAPEVVGKDYKHGGIDAFFVGWTGDPFPDMSQWFTRSNFVPAGTNLAYIDSTEVEGIINETLDPANTVAEREAAWTDFQEWFYDNIPYHIMLQELNLWAHDPDLHGGQYDSWGWPNYYNLTHGGTDGDVNTDGDKPTVIVVSTPGEFIDSNPWIVGSYYDGLAVYPIYESLLSGPLPDDLGTYYGAVAETWSGSADGLEWTFNLRSDVKFSNGDALTADDVVWSYEQVLKPDVGAYSQVFYSTYFDTIEKVDADTVKVTLKQGYAYAEGLAGGVPILDMSEFSGVADADFESHSTNTGTPARGSGPYMWDAANSNWAQSTARLTLNPHYVASRYLSGANPHAIQNIEVKLYTTAASTVADLSNNILDVIDANTGIQPFLDDLNASANAEIVISPDLGHQAFYPNQNSPYWGMNPKDPRVLYPEDYVSPVDIVGILAALMTLGLIGQVYRYRKRKN